MSRMTVLCGTLVLLAATVNDAASAELVVGANIGNVPWEFQNAQGEFVGFETDLAKEIGSLLCAALL